MFLRSASTPHSSHSLLRLVSNLNLCTSRRCFSVASSSSQSQHPLQVSHRRPLLVHNITGITPYTTAWEWQKRITREKIACERTLKAHLRSSSSEANTTAAPPTPTTVDPSSLPLGFADRLLLLEHSPIYTLGRNSVLENIRFPPDVPVRVVERGDLSEPAITVTNQHSDSSSTSSIPTTSSSSPPTSHAPRRYDIIRVERGGEVTYHGPGQMILYPLIALQPLGVVYSYSPAPAAPSSTLTEASSSTSPYKPDLHWFLRSLESVVIRFLRLYNITGERIDGASGVWVRMQPSEASTRRLHPSSSSMKKIAAIGLSCSSWVTMHGCSINIDNDLEPYSWIVPCGLSDATKFGGVTNLREILKEHRATNSQSSSLIPIDHALMRKQLIACFEEEFQLDARIAEQEDL